MSHITVSDFALESISELLRENDMEGYGLYLGIRGGGCSGYSYCLPPTRTSSSARATFASSWGR